MRSDLENVLRETAPERVPQLDMRRLARRGRRRRVVARGVAVAGTLALVLGVASVVQLPGTGMDVAEQPGGSSGGDRWTQSQPITVGASMRLRAASAAGGQVVVWADGEPVSEDGAVVHVFNPEDNRWTTSPPAPLTGEVWGWAGRVFGPPTSGVALTDGSRAAVYDVQAGTWTSVPPLDGSADVTVVGYHDDELFAVGADGLHGWTKADSWTLLTPHPDGQPFTSSAVVRPAGDRIAVVDASTSQADVWLIDRTDGQLTPLPAIRLEVTDPSLYRPWWCNDQLVISGAESVMGDPENGPGYHTYDAAAFDPDARDWTDEHGPCLLPPPEASTGDVHITSAGPMVRTAGAAGQEPFSIWRLTDAGWTQTPTPLAAVEVPTVAVTSQQTVVIRATTHETAEAWIGPLRR